MSVLEIDNEYFEENDIYKNDCCMYINKHIKFVSKKTNKSIVWTLLPNEQPRYRIYTSNMFNKYFITYLLTYKINNEINNKRQFDIREVIEKILGELKNANQRNKDQN